MNKALTFLLFPVVAVVTLALVGLLFQPVVFATVTKNWITQDSYSLFNAGLGGLDVAVTQGQKGTKDSMEFTTTDSAGKQATRMMLRGKTNDANLEFYSGAKGSEVLKFMVEGVTGHLKWGSRGMLKNNQGASIELGGTGTPYLDFSNDTTIDYDARLILTGDDSLNFAGTNVGIGNNSPVAKLDVNGDIATRNSGSVSSNNNNLAGVSLSWMGDQARIRIGGDGPGAKKGLAIQEVGNVTVLKVDEVGGVVKMTTDYPSICIGKC